MREPIDVGEIASKSLIICNAAKLSSWGQLCLGWNVERYVDLDPWLWVFCLWRKHFFFCTAVNRQPPVTVLFIQIVVSAGYPINLEHSVIVFEMKKTSFGKRHAHRLWAMMLAIGDA